MIDDATTHDVTAALEDWRAGRPGALDRLLPRIYGELRVLARRRMRRERRGHTLEPTALVHEVFLRLIGQRRVDWQDRSHFFAVAAQAMRRVLVDHARRQRAGNRIGAHDTVRIEQAGELAIRNRAPLDVLDVDRALEKLAALEPRQARLVELRFFGGLTVREAAAALDVSAPTAVRDWQMAKAWLSRILRDG